MKRLYIKTYGCQMNVYDSARMADVLAPLGYAPADSPEDADMVILNTCHIREKAAEKVFSELGRLQGPEAGEVRGRRAHDPRRRRLRRPGRGRRDPRAAPRTSTSWSGPQAYHRLPELVAKAARAGGAALDTDFPVEPKFDFLPAVGDAARRQRLPHRAGGLRQVLHLLRRALHARRRVFAPGGRA